VNAGSAIYVSGRVATITEGIEMAREAIDTNKVLNHFHTIAQKQEEHKYA
jgi:anthranilate phosphoribosyltransferase